MRLRDAGPFNDAENLTQQIPGARLVQARSMVELRLTPERLSREIVWFLDEVYSPPEPSRAVADGTRGSASSRSLARLRLQARN